MATSIFIEVKSLAGSNFIVASEVIAVQQMDVAKCTIMMAGGISVPCNEAAKDIAARVDAALRASKETKHGHARS